MFFEIGNTTIESRSLRGSVDRNQQKPAKDCKGNGSLPSRARGLKRDNATNVRLNRGRSLRGSVDRNKGDKEHRFGCRYRDRAASQTWG